MSAIISPCGKYRYRLERHLETGHATACVVMVNPSTADAVENDATIRKVLGFAGVHNWGKVIVGNLFAYRTKDVRRLGAVVDPIGPGNDAHLRSMMRDAGIVLFAWGPVAKVPSDQRQRWRDVLAIARDVGHTPLCLSTAKDGHPRHPLMLPYSTPLTLWEPPL